MEKDSHKSNKAHRKSKRISNANEIQSVHHETEPSLDNEIIEENKYVSSTKKRIPESEIFQKKI